MKKPLTTQKKLRVQKAYLNIKINLFFIVLMAIAVIGLLLPLRPTESASEKRTLEKFPEFSVASFLDGSYFNQISTWYADTFPFRESLISANASIKGLYGLQGEQIVSNTNRTGDEIPDDFIIPAEPDSNTTPAPPEVPESDPAGSAPDESESIPSTAETQPETPAETLPETEAETETESETESETEPESHEDGAIQVVPEQAGNVYIAGDTAFSIYYFNLDTAGSYVSMLDKAQQKLDGIAQVYDIVVPTSVGVCLDEAAQEKIGSSNQKDAIDYIYSGIATMNPKIKTVDAFQNLYNHNSEYIYFRTDHHWTALGAYYTYEAFCQAKGIEANDLSSYQTVEYPGFIGSLYSASNKAPTLRENPDTVIGYIPKTTNQMVFYDKDKNCQETHWPIVNDVTDYPAGSKYSAFAAADQCYAFISNPTITDGSSCVVIKESYGNAFIPFLADHYQNVYIVDYRYFSAYPRYNNSVYQLITENNVQDVIFINNMDAVADPGKISLMGSLFN